MQRKSANLNARSANLQRKLCAVNIDTTNVGKERKNKFERDSKKKASNNNNKNKDKNVFHIGSSKHSSDYESTSQCLMSNVKKEHVRGSDTLEALRKISCLCIASWELTLTVLG